MFLKIAIKPNNYQFCLPDFLKFCGNIPHNLLRPSQFQKKTWKFCNGPLCKNKSCPSPLPPLNAAAC